MVLDIKHIDAHGQEFSWMPEYLMGEEFKEVRVELQNRKFRIPPETLSYRTLNHWEQKGLISFERTDDKGWRRFSIVEIIWVEIMLSLREIGYPLKQIKIIKDEMLSPEQLSSISSAPFPQLEYNIFRVLNDKIQTYFIIDQDRSISFQTDEEYQLVRKVNMAFNDVNTHIIIPLNFLLKKHVGSEADNSFDLFSNNLDSKETDLLNLVRSPKVEIISIIMDDGKIKRIRSRSVKDPKTNIAAVERSALDQDITIKIRGGKKVAIDQEIITKEKSS